MQTVKLSKEEMVIRNTLIDMRVHAIRVKRFRALLATGVKWSGIW